MIPQQLQALGFTVEAVQNAITWGFMCVFGFWLFGYVSGTVISLIRRF